MNLKLKKITFFIGWFFSFFTCASAHAAFSLIRDAETEKFLRDLSSPVFLVANLNPRNIHVYIVNDSSINAFVSGGQNVFINTGLIRKYQTPDALIGVVAHETGHIVAGHIARSSEEMQKANAAMLLSYLLGIGAVVAGAADAGQGIIMGGSQTAERLYMKFSRTQEEAADRHALVYLERINYPATGLLTLLEFFESEMRAYDGKIDEYALSHPVSRKRIDYLRNNFSKKRISDEKINHQLQPSMNRVLAKLEGFIDDADYVIKKYKNDNRDNANYAKTIAYYRKGKSAEALKLLDKVIENNMEDGFLYELKAQILFESGNINDAIVFYDKAIKMLSRQDSSQAKIYFALAILTLPSHDKGLMQAAITRLKEAKEFEEDNAFLFKQLSNAYNKLGDEGRSFAALAEYNFLINDKKKAKKYAQNAKDIFLKVKNKNEVRADILRLEDLLELIKNDKDFKEEN